MTLHSNAGHPTAAPYKPNALALPNPITVTAAATPTPCTNRCIHTPASATTTQHPITNPRKSHRRSDPGLSGGDSSSAPPSPATLGTRSPRSREASPSPAPTAPAARTVISGTAQKTVTLVASDTLPAANCSTAAGSATRQLPAAPTRTPRTQGSPLQPPCKDATDKPTNAISPK